MSFGLAYAVGIGAGLVVAFACTLPELLRAPKRQPGRRHLRLRWEPRDLWVGIYREPSTRRTFICPLPAVVLILEPRESERS